MNTTKQAIIKDLKRVYQLNNEISLLLYHKYGKFSREQLLEHFSKPSQEGGQRIDLKAIYEAVGANRVQTLTIKQQIIKDVQDVARGRDITITQYLESGRFTQSVVLREFKKWNEVKRQAGLFNNAKKLDIVKDARQVLSDCNKYTIANYMERGGKYTLRQILYAFDKWSELKTLVKLNDKQIDILEDTLQNIDNIQDVSVDLVTKKLKYSYQQIIYSFNSFVDFKLILSKLIR